MTIIVAAKTYSSGTTTTLDVPHSNSLIAYQIDAFGNGTVEVKTRLKTAANFNSQVALTDSTALINMVDVEQIQLVVSGGPSEVVISSVGK